MNISAAPRHGRDAPRAPVPRVRSHELDGLDLAGGAPTSSNLEEGSLSAVLRRYKSEAWTMSPAGGRVPLPNNS